MFITYLRCLNCGIRIFTINNQYLRCLNCGIRIFSKISTNNNNTNTNVDQVTNDVVLVDITPTSTPKLTPPLHPHPHPHPQPKSKNRHSTKNNSTKNSYRNANKEANKNFKPSLNNSTNVSPLLINNDQIMSKHVNDNNNINVIEFSNLFTNSFSLLFIMVIILVPKW